MLQAIDYLLDSSKEVAIIGDLKHPKTQLMLQALSTTYLPNMVLAVGSPEKKTAANEIKLLSAKVLSATNTEVSMSVQIKPASFPQQTFTPPLNWQIAPSFTKSNK